MTGIDTNPVASSARPVSAPLAPAQQDEAARLAVKYDVTIRDNGDGTLTVSAPARDGQHGLSMTVRSIDGIDPTPTEHGAMARAQTETARGQGEKIRIAFEETKTQILDGKGMHRALGRPPTPVEVEREAARMLGMDGFAPVPVEAAGSQSRADIATATAYAEHQGYANSNRDRVAAVAASARTGFAVPAETFALDPHHGLAGAGHEAAPFSGSGGQMSDTGIAHDTDYFVGFHTGQGPMGSLATLRQKGVEAPIGLHGLDMTQRLPGVDIDQLRDEQGIVSDTRDIPQYDPLFSGDLPDGWRGRIYGTSDGAAVNAKIVEHVRELITATLGEAPTDAQVLDAARRTAGWRGDADGYGQGFIPHVPAWLSNAAAPHPGFAAGQTAR